MKKTISLGKALCFVLLTGVFFLLSVNNSSAQENAQGSVNPYTHIATKLDVSAYPLGTFDRHHCMEVLDQILTGLKPLMGNGGGTLNQKLKYDYCSKMLLDINSQYVAPEITMLTSLSGLTEKTNTAGIEQSQLRTLYNEIAAQMQ